MSGRLVVGVVVLAIGIAWLLAAAGLASPTIADRLFDALVVGAVVALAVIALRRA